MTQRLLWGGQIADKKAPCHFQSLLPTWNKFMIIAVELFYSWFSIIALVDWVCYYWLMITEFGDLHAENWGKQHKPAL